MLDLSGMQQVFQESEQYGVKYELQYISIKTRIVTSSGIEISNLLPFHHFTPKQHDIVCIPGAKSPQADPDDFIPFFNWLTVAHINGAKICSICSGAFLLAQSGLLDGRSCTTHWGLTSQLQRQFPKLQVKKDILFTKDETIYTSAGFTTGIDLALFLLEENHGGEITARVARELVVYIRRDGSDQQMSIYIQYRSHQDEKVHTVQDWIIHNLEKKTSLQQLSNLVHTSPRNLSRIFKKITGITITDYRNKVRKEKAEILLKNSDYKMDHIAQLCGYTSSRQLRSLLRFEDR